MSDPVIAGSVRQIAGPGVVAEPSEGVGQSVDRWLSREWLVANGLGGYASGTVPGLPTRKYHGLLVAALHAPLGRTLMFNHLEEYFLLPSREMVRFGGAEWEGGHVELYGLSHLHEFRLEAGLPVWTYRVADRVVEKRLFLAHGQNTVFVTFQILSGSGPLTLRLRPLLRFRSHDGPVDGHVVEPYLLTVLGERYEVHGPPPWPVLRLHPHGGSSRAFVCEGVTARKMFFRVEAARGYEAVSDLWSPGYFRMELQPGQLGALVGSTEPWETMLALSPEEAAQAEKSRREGLLRKAGKVAADPFAAELVLAADSFLIAPATRTGDEARARAAGEEARTVIAGYHWFTDWGRDTMISLEGLTLVTGRHREAAYLLHTFASHVRDGLIPNLFPEGQNEGLYHTADATMWFFHALDRYERATGDRDTLRNLLPTLRNIVDHHVRGTRFGIGVDPKDGLLRQGAEGYQLTWMDAKVGDWVVTPRRGKAVEINALWYNALRNMEGWMRQEGGEEAGTPFAELAERVRKSFNERFWNPQAGCLFDVVDAEKGGNDPAVRPNQVFAISLPHPVLERERWQPVLDVVERVLLTPVGLRSLAPGDPEYKARYDGNLWARDAAYHQGTVWGWLIGPFLDAWVKLHPERRAEAARYLEGFRHHLNEACVGTISEIFDADEPYTPRGCVSQAWSVAEVLRTLVQARASS